MFCIWKGVGHDFVALRLRAGGVAAFGSVRALPQSGTADVHAGVEHPSGSAPATQREVLRGFYGDKQWWADWSTVVGSLKNE
jgi:hypothetical protein